MFIKTGYSILNSSINLKKAIDVLKGKEFSSAIICDDQMFGTLEFYYACKKAEIKPIISTYKEIDGVSLILISKNVNGYKNLSRMSQFKDLTKEILNEFKSDIIVVVSFETNPSDMAIKTIDFLKENISELYAGIRHSESIQDSVKEAFIKSLNLPMIVEEIATHIKEEDYRQVNALKAIGDKTLFDNVSTKNSCRVSAYIKSKDFYKSYDKELVSNLFNIISSCVDDYKFGNPTPPKYKFCKETSLEYGLNPETNEEELFAFLSRRGLEERLLLIPSEKHQEYRDRLEFEIKIINQMKFPGYMLIVWDFTAAAKQMDIPVGPGRGSAAGSLVAFSLKITDIDPLPYGLLFERFLNPERVSMPDIDMDFCQSRRGEIIDYVIEKYGLDNVAQIITFGQLGGRSVIKDTSRILSYPLHLAEAFSKAIPEKPGIKLDEAYESEKDIIDNIVSNSHAKRVWNLSKKLEGSKKNLGVHAAGLVISDTNITENCPKCHVGDTQVVQYEGKYLEDVNLIKFDFLGLKTLSVIKEAISMIKENRGITVDFSTIDVNDKKVYDYISTGKTVGMFQIESSGMQGLCKRLKPDCFEDLIAILALYRPGPMESGMLEDFIQRKKGEQKISYFFDEMTTTLEPILKPTYGVIVYQEQVMQIVQEIGGFSLGESDIIRRAMGKKQIDYMTQKAEEFAERAEKKGFKKENAKELFGLIEKFAGYGFNKSHSAAYALITFYTGYLKAYFPVEFMAALMNFTYDKQDKLIPIFQETISMGIKVNKPDVNTSTELFSVKENEIVYGLKAIKGAGAGVEGVISKRPPLGYESLSSFLKINRLKGAKLNLRVLSGLVASGALDTFASRGYLQENIENFMKMKKVDEFEGINKIPNEILFGTNLKLLEQIKLEKDFLGHIYANPFESIQETLEQYEIPSLNELTTGLNRTVVWIEDIKYLTSKKGAKYARVSLIDINRNSEELMMFSKGIDKVKEFVGTDKNKLTKPVLLDISVKDDEQKFVNDISALTKTLLGTNFVERTEKLETCLNIEENDFEALFSIPDYINTINIMSKEKLSYTIIR